MNCSVTRRAHSREPPARVAGSSNWPMAEPCFWMKWATCMVDRKPNCLRVLQEGEFHRVGGEQPIRVSVRVVSATNKNLPELVAQDKFREDLYYRLCVVPIRVPSLRERPTDIRALAEYFLSEFCARNNFRPKSLDESVSRCWKATTGPGMHASCATPSSAWRFSRRTTAWTSIRFRWKSASLAIPVPNRICAKPGNRPNAIISGGRLDESGWNVSSAARALGMERTNLHKRMRALGLSRAS